MSDDPPVPPPSQTTKHPAVDEGELFERLRQYEPEIRRAARVRLSPLLRPHLDSVDLVQSVFITLLAGLRNDKLDLSRPEKLVALSAEIIRRKVARVWRQMQNRARLNDRLDLPREIDPQSIPSSCEGNDPTDAAQYRDEVRQVMAHLDSAEQRLVELRLEGYSTAEAARALDANSDVLRVRLSRLRKKLRDLGVMTDWL
jgi:RNA polymerase sigma-70 factor (ECF subfamily)